jgi:hypothetical protein
VEDGVRIPLALEAFGSIFVVFSDTPVWTSDAVNHQPLQRHSLDGPWHLTFKDGRGAPETVELHELASWTEHPDPAVRYYSGVVRYRTTFKAAHTDGAWSLDLGELWAVGEVFLNGTSLGIVWKPPYKLDISGALQPGENILEIDVANTWVNRLIGDARRVGKQRYTKTNITRSGTPGKPWKDLEPKRSGLFGPVTLIHKGSD